MSRFKRLATEGGWIVVGQIAAVAGAVVLVRVLTEILEPAQYGELALGLTVAGLVNQVVLGAIANGISRFYSVAAEKNDLGAYLHDTGRLLGYATLVLVAISVVLIAALLWRAFVRPVVVSSGAAISFGQSAAVGVGCLTALIM